MDTEVAEQAPTYEELLARFRQQEETIRNLTKEVERLQVVAATKEPVAAGPDTPDESEFPGFEPANTTPVPDIFFDRLLVELSAPEMKVILYIIRRTAGFKKKTDGISLRQFTCGITTKDGRVLDKGCGVTVRSRVIKTLESLEKRGFIQSWKRKDGKGNLVTVYGIRYRGSKVEQNDTHKMDSKPKTEKQGNQENHNATKVPPSPDTLKKKSQNPASPEAVAVMDWFDEIVGEPSPRTEKHIQAAIALAACHPTKEEMQRRHDYGQADNPEWYQKHRLDLQSLANNWTKWKGTPQAPPPVQGKSINDEIRRYLQGLDHVILPKSVPKPVAPTS